MSADKKQSAGADAINRRLYIPESRISNGQNPFEKYYIYRGPKGLCKNTRRYVRKKYVIADNA